ncbi:MAG: PBP1A family penicillin-binding protein [Mariprofundaceae bacterium]|nr:PBP1A family penicillin-binding protein [Mariprofundaceae bacterium]
MVVAVICGTVAYYHFSSKLPTLVSLAAYQPALASRVYNTDGDLLAEYADQHRILTPIQEIPQRLRNAFLAAEDQQFYQHPGINPVRIVSAAISNYFAGHAVQGGSTITQQVVKNFLLSPERTYTRKIREAILAYRIEQVFSKDDILYLYLNEIFLGRGSYGVTSAAWRYFGKRLNELSLAECAMLAALPKAPSAHGPHIHPKLAKKRRNIVLTLMETSGLASAKAVAKAKSEPIYAIKHLRGNRLKDSYGNEIYAQLIDLFGAKALRRQGMTIIVPYQPKMQEAATRAVRENLLTMEQHQFYRTPKVLPVGQWDALLATWKKAQGTPHSLDTDEIIPALVEVVVNNGDLQVNDGLHRWRISKPKWAWARGKNKQERAHPRHWQVGDQVYLQGVADGGVRLTQKPSIESSLYAVDLQRGTVLARVGGFDFKFSGFDRVSHSKRQPGSSFKPLLYAVAMDHGLTPASIIMDTPIVFDNGKTDGFWRPENYKNKFAGPVTVRDALEHSRNLASIKILQDIGVSTFTRKLAEFPLKRMFPRQLALALGVTEVSLQALTESYIPLASQGYKWKPIVVQHIQDRSGRTLHRAVAGQRCKVCHVEPVSSVSDAMQPATKILSSATAFLVTNMMKGVVERGTGRRAKALKRPVAGKTGTTNDQVDAWFMGFTPQVLTGVWTGRDIPKSMGHSATGARAALPAWLQAMQAFHEDKPVMNFVAPNTIEWVMIDRKTGRLANASTHNRFLESFKKGTAPQVGDVYQDYPAYVPAPAIDASIAVVLPEPARSVSIKTLDAATPQPLVSSRNPKRATPPRAKLPPVTRSRSHDFFNDDL